MTDKVICRFHASTGGCRNGVNCRFSHDLSNVPSQVCLYFMAGHCAFGSRCRYAHVHPDGTPLNEEQQHPRGDAREGQHAARQQAAEPASSRGTSQAALNGSYDAVGQWGATSVMPPGCADAAWEDEEPSSSLAGGPASAAQRQQDALPRYHVARPRPLSRTPAAHDEAHPGADEPPRTEGNPYSSYEDANGLYPGAVQDRQCDWPIGQYPRAQHAQHPAGGSQAPNGMSAEAYEDDEWDEVGPSYDEWVAEKGFSDEEGWVQHCMETVLQQEQPGFTLDENGYPVDDHGYGDGQHRSFDCDSYPDECDESDYGYQKLLDEFAEQSGLEVPPRPEHFRVPAFIDPHNSLEQWRRGEGTAGPARPQTDDRLDASAWPSAPTLRNLPGSSPPVQPEGDLCAQYCREGTCSKGASCERLHGIYCKNCQRFALHPSDAQQRSEHAAECLARHRRMSSHLASQLIECCICMELVLSKPEAAERKFGLLDCNHAFCLGCIRDWRSRTEGGADVETAVRACPVCRQATHYVTPSLVWPADEDEKEAIMGAYRNKLASIDCRNFDFGAGTCPFGTSCMYRHAYKNGQLEERKFRKRVDADGEVGGLRDHRLSEFLEVSLRSQQAVRRAIRGAL